MNTLLMLLVKLQNKLRVETAREIGFTLQVGFIQV